MFSAFYKKIIVWGNADPNLSLVNKIMWSDVHI